MMTCLAVWAPMRPTVSSGSSGTPLCVPLIEPSSRSIVHDDFFFFAVLLLGGRDQRRLDRLKDDLLVDVLVAMDRIDDPQHFVGVHFVFTSNR